MLKAKVFESDKGQAILIPKEFHTDQKELFFNDMGGVYVFWPTNDRWLPFKQTAGTFPEDFMNDREQPMLNVER